ncbi:xanthine dehydrogenase family protein molybdopterin-binding subunit [Rhodoplanes sp. Z2-YC6860]|uniref:xanthine dehydrogenase family protein molybdopterin-binding subunit n=1 Tax=Rhodoplanes sp. Z2-YC6860 TaxID=674703 RepID=UPI00078D5AAC|nr:xanthine dehydrogenase family protein molybdopterin-binding subunit [Rhodoplanes sp. Z2-YC6860]AMN43796.1 aldehyde oxidase and xanthine dehydrogenase molybdopterin binding protein [Rhodoplanes sp. Z2-YC6860]
MSAPEKRFRFISSDRRVREDRRFVVGKGNFAADIVPQGVKHVALVTCPHPAAKIVSIDKSAALAMPGVHYVLDGAELAGATNVLASGLETPNVPRRPLAVDVARYAGEWVAAVVADSRALAEDAAELIAVEYEPLPFVLDGEQAYKGGVLVHPAHGTNVLLDRTFVWGEVEKDFTASPHKFRHVVKWGRSATVPVETFGVTASWDPWREMLDVWASIQMPKYPDQIAMTMKLPMSSVRVHYDVDVGGSYGVKRGIKHTILVAYLTRRLGMPIRFIEDRLENMRGGDMHGPERNFDVEVAFDNQGIIRSMKMRALDNVGAYAGRSPFQLGKPVGAIVGPYKIKSVQYQAIAVLSNKTVQEAVRAFGQSPTNYAIERTIEEVANKLGLDRLEVRQRNMIRPDDFPYLIPSGSTYDSGNYQAVIEKVLAKAGYEALVAERDRLREAGTLAGIGIASCLEPSGGNSSFEPLLNPKVGTTTWMDSCRISIDLVGSITATMHTTSAGQGHETLVGTVVGEVLEVDPDKVRVVRADSLNSLPSNSPVGSRMAIMLGGAAFHAAKKLKAKLVAIAAHDLGVPLERMTYQNGDVFDASLPDKKRTWTELVTIGHRYIHRLPPDMEPGLSVSHIMPVPTGGGLPTADGRVQMYPCYSFEFHLMLVTIDPELGKPEIKRYVIGHDCGVVINPKIVRGMTMGGIAHGIGAALYEEFAYNDDGLLVAQNFMDYLLPSAHEVPPVEIVHHETPSPLTVFGQKGSGESGYLGAPAAVASAVNDAIRPLGIVVNSLPIKVARLGDMIAAAREGKAI